jgi:non-heme chloroperoxidase
MGYYVRVEPNVKIYVEDLNPEGERTILFLHGWPGSHRLFEYQFDQLPKMGYRCIGIDTRGFGSSDKPYGGKVLKIQNSYHLNISAMDFSTTSVKNLTKN